MTSAEPLADRRPSSEIDGCFEPIALTKPHHTLRRCPLHRRTDLAAAHVAVSNYDATSIGRPTENKESR
jgi:hypothetical protein